MDANTVAILIVVLVAVYYIWKVWKSFMQGLTEEEITIFTTSDIGREYQAIKMVEGAGKTKKTAKENINKMAHKLKADAIVDFSSNIESTTSGSISSLGGVHGKTKTSHKYYYTGTAVKFI